jgi:succinate dehydrogenase / fumarate reductase cytochrome b subunit
MTRQRPFFLNLLVIRLPVGGVVSIMHRASGVFLSLAIPCLLYSLMLSLRSPEDFTLLRHFFSGGLGRVIAVMATWVFLHHFLAGLRHLGLDIGKGESRERARLTAWIALFGAMVLTLLGMLA